MKKYKHGIACYPVEWKEYVISPKKICFQFKNVECKTRIKDRDMRELIQLGNNNWALPIEQQPVQVSFIAIGLMMEGHKEMLDQLLNAYEEYIALYDNDFKEHLVKVNKRLTEILDASKK
jgi:hypothetical protein